MFNRIGFLACCLINGIPFCDEQWKRTAMQDSPSDSKQQEAEEPLLVLTCLWVNRAEQDCHLGERLTLDHVFFINIILIINQQNV